MAAIKHSSNPEHSIVHFKGYLTPDDTTESGKKLFSSEQLSEFSEIIKKNAIPVCVGMDENGENPYGFTSGAEFKDNMLVVEATICHGVVKQLMSMNMITMTLEYSKIDNSINPEYIALLPIYSNRPKIRQIPVTILK